jgi:glycosyltransferase involved in cell wall biosynthesis
VREKSLTIFIPHPSALLTDHQPNGDGLTAFGFIDHLAKRGHRLHVAVQECALERPLDSNITLYPLKCRMKAPILRRLEYMLRVRLLFAGLRRKHSFDLIHQMNPVYSGLSLALIGTAVPLVLGTYVARWPDDPDSLRSPLPGVNRILRRGREMICRLQQSQASTLLLTTPAAMNRISEGPGLGKKVVLLQHGIDVSLFHPASGADPFAEEPSILFFANLWKRKGIYVLLKAFPQVIAAIPGCRLTVAGGGPELSQVAALIEGMAVKHQIDLLGPIERSAAPELFRGHSLYCLPSLGEPYGMSALEAMSCGLAVVASADGGLGYMLPKEGSILVKPGNVNELASALIELLRSPERRAKMGRYNREYAAEHFAWPAVVDELERIYEETLSRGLLSARTVPMTSKRGTSAA